jgi:hypothetical protein
MVGRRVLAAFLLVMAASSPVGAVEGTQTDVDVTLKFGAGCIGSGTVEIWDPGGRTDMGEAIHRTPLAWSPGYTIRIRTAFGGAAGPHLRLMNAQGTLLVEIALTGWPGAEGGSDGYDIVCSRQRYAARPDLISWLGGAALLLGLLVSVWRLPRQIALRKSPLPERTSA